MSYLNQKHLQYANYLNNKGIEFIYREVYVDYTDTFSGKRKRFYIDFVLLLDTPEWVEVTRSAKPTDKRIVAERRAKEAGIVFRGLMPEEISVVYAQL